MFPRILLLAILCFAPVLFPATAGAGAVIADHVGVAEFDLIPASVIEDIQDNCRFFYGHTSHGSQIMTGLDLLYAEDPFYAEPPFTEYGDDLGHNGDVSWVQPTRDYLDAHPDCNVVMWSWCGGCSDNTEAGINIYLNAMNQLETDYPAVTFIYMTGHLDGTGPGGNLYARNNQIRDWCAANDKVLFDFADIESWDPDGTYYPDESDYCNWCYTWCGTHTCPSCGCAHSHCFNCYLKGKGFWWMMARVRGWDPLTEVGSGDPAGPVPFGLEPNRPNPFHRGTQIGFSLPETSPARVEIFDVAGRRIRVLHSGSLGAGPHVLWWDGCDSEGQPVAAGSYFYRLQAGDVTDTRKMTLIR